MTAPTPLTPSISTAPVEMARVLVWHGGGDLRMQEVPIPELQEGETLVETTTITICDSDRHIVFGRHSMPCPSVLGYEGVDIIRITRSPGLQTDQRVVFSVTVSCVECDHYERGMTTKCRNLKKIGREAFDSNWPLSGIYASHIVLRNHQPMVVVPDSLTDKVVSIATCAGTAMMTYVEQTGPLTGKRVPVMGIGVLGLTTVEATVRDGTAEVVAIGHSQTRLERAQQLDVIMPDPSAAGADPEPEPFDITLELSDNESGATTCIGNLGIGDRAVLAGSVATPLDCALDSEWLVRGWRTITGVHSYEPWYLEQAVNFLADPQISQDIIVLRPTTLEDAPTEMGIALSPNVLLQAAVKPS